MTILAMVIVLAQLSLVGVVAYQLRRRYGISPWRGPAGCFILVGSLMVGRRVTAWLILLYGNFLGSILPWMDQVVLPGCITALTGLGFWWLARSMTAAEHRLFIPEAPAEITIDEHSIVRIWNMAAERLFGYTAADALGQFLPDLVIPETERAAHLAGVARYLTLGDPGRVIGGRIPVRARDRAGIEFPVEVEVSVRREGETVRFDAKVRRLLTI